MLEAALDFVERYGAEADTLGKKVEPLDPAEQRRRFEELPRELGTDNGETLDRVFGKFVPPKAKKADAS